MIKFIEEQGEPVAARLVCDGTGFDTEPRPSGCVASVLVNDLELMLNEEDQRVVFLTGYCPHQAWQRATLRPPPAHRGSLRVELDSPMVPGVSVRLHPWQEAWPARVDPASGWVRLGRSAPDEDRAGVEFAPGGIAILEGERLVALWLHPDRLPPL